jgi:aspartokinase
MRDLIREVMVLRVTIEREKLAKDEKSIRKIFQVLEECRVPCECMAINIDWLAVYVRQAENGKLKRCMLRLGQELDRINITIDRDVRMLCIEGRQMTPRDVGMIASGLTMQDIEIKMQRYLRCRDLFVVCVSAGEAEESRRIISELLVSDLVQ